MNPSLTVSERLKFAVWDDPIGDKYNKLWRVIQDTGMPNTMKEAIQRVRKSTPDDGFAFLGDGPELRYMEATSCDLKTVGKDYGLRYKAMVIQEDSPLKEMLDDAYVLTVLISQIFKFKCVFVLSRIPEFLN